LESCPYTLFGYKDIHPVRGSSVTEALWRLRRGFDSRTRTFSARSEATSGKSVRRESKQRAAEQREAASEVRFSHPDLEAFYVENSEIFVLFSGSRNKAEKKRMPHIVAFRLLINDRIIIKSALENKPSQKHPRE
jgi:hypothetical protein